MAEPLRQLGDETDPTLAWICDGLVRHLKGEGEKDRYVRTYRLLAKHLLDRLPPGEAQRLRQAPEAARGTLTDLVAARLHDDARTRQLVAVLLSPPNAQRSSPRRDEKISRILFLSFQSDRQEALEIAEEERQIRQSLLRARYGRQIELIVGSAIRARDFSWYLLEYDPDILHFSGHGYQGAILVENDGGEDWPLEGHRLAELFGIYKNRLRCVILNACYSGMEAGPIAQEVGAAVVRADAVKDPAAIVFAEHFYEGLGYGRTLRHSFDLGCWAVKARGDWGARALPQLLGEAQEIRFVSDDES